MRYINGLRKFKIQAELEFKLSGSLFWWEISYFYKSPNMIPLIQIVSMKYKRPVESTFN